MRKRYGLLAVTGGALLAILLLFLLTRERELVYQGKELSYWVRVWTEGHGDGATRSQAREAIFALGTNNLDLFVRRLSYDPRQDGVIKAFRLLPMRFLVRLDLRFLTRGSRQADDAQQVLRTLGPAAAPAIPQLTKLLDSGTYGPSSRALDVLTHVGEQGLAIVASRVALTKGPIHFQLISALTYHTNYPPAFAALTNALNDPDPNARTAAADILAGRVFE